ncbi:bifunctional DNA-formamidopyrimidine glycosylase/DNA-(apurinic or apyrimidinic site) lyase [bacterium]|nr:bifunctional DNA-formamidopyrimidine glycosylase/DNA-(apurinic or apyrimidinic site) lyase [bacterium]
MKGCEVPELPEVESICRMLTDRIVGRKVVSVDVSLPRIIRCGRLDSIINHRFSSVYRRGKYICFELDDSLKMFAHLRMTGTFLWKDDLIETVSHIRVEIRFEDGCLLYRDVRTLGGIWISNDGTEPWQTLGIDPLDEEFTSEALAKRLSKRKMAVKQVLMNQSIIAGIGNIYASEVLFSAGIDPQRIACSLTVLEIERLRNAITSVLSAAINSGGTTFRDFRLSDGKDGAFQEFLKVYRKAGEACSRCGTKIRRIVQAQRSSYLCPKCQR